MRDCAAHSRSMPTAVSLQHVAERQRIRSRRRRPIRKEALISFGKVDYRLFVTDLRRRRAYRRSRSPPVAAALLLGRHACSRRAGRAMAEAGAMPRPIASSIPSRFHIGGSQLSLIDGRSHCAHAEGAVRAAILHVHFPAAACFIAKCISADLHVDRFPSI